MMYLSQQVMAYGRTGEETARRSSAVVGETLLVTRFPSVHEARQQTDLLHPSVHRSTKWTRPRLWHLTKKQDNISM
jgi:hypothetical protein